MFPQTLEPGQQDDKCQPLEANQASKLELAPLIQTSRLEITPVNQSSLITPVNQEHDPSVTPVNRERDPSIAPVGHDQNLTLKLDTGEEEKLPYISSSKIDDSESFDKTVIQESTSSVGLSTGKITLADASK